jgi:catechol 2,3-dioxygenase-like lactoylglutathione lyase family enzyme
MPRFTAAIGSFTVDDIEVAHRFYADTLGLEVSRALPGPDSPLWMRAGGNASVFVYPKPDHKPAGFTVLNLTVDDIESALDELTGAGIAFLRFDRYGQDERGIYRGEGHAIAWFSDPAGNSLALVQLDQLP